MHLTPIFNTHKTQADSHVEFSRRSPPASHLCVQQSRLLILDLILNSQIGTCFQPVVALRNKNSQESMHLFIFRPVTVSASSTSTDILPKNKMRITRI